MKKINFKSFAPHILAVLLFVIITMGYLWPLLEGKRLSQSDITQFKGMSKEIVDYRESTGKEALWTNRMFGGMPAYQISVVYSSNLIKYIDRIFHLWLPHPAGLVFFYFIGFYILLLVFRVDPKLSIIGACGFAFSSFFFIILVAGHNSQSSAIGYMPPVLAGIILCFRGKYILGGALTALFLALELNANHVQMTYYLMLTVVILGIAEFIGKYRDKKIKEFFKAIIVMVVALVLALGTNITNLWSTYEYGKYTTRGKSELTNNMANKTSGLDRDYATDWSYGKWETFTLLIPNYMGGGSENLGTNSNTYKALIEKGYPKAQAEKAVKGLPTYWGAQPFTSGPVYAGAVMCFLFILGLFIVKGKYKWWLLSATILSFFLAWGRNMMWFTNIFFDYVPGYNKFRSVSFTLVIAELCIPILAMLALGKLFDKNVLKEVKLKALKYSSIITISLIVVFGLIGSMFFNYVVDKDNEYVTRGYFPDWFLTALQSDRPGLMVADSIRSLIFILITAILLWLLTIDKIKNKTIVIIAIIALVIIDMWTVNKRYLNSDNFVASSKVKTPYTPTEADLMIMQDKTIDYRVYNLTVSPFNDAGTSYFHNSIGGYHGAKLKRYQELIENQISKNNMNVLNMLNTRYFIVPDSLRNPVAQRNPKALGNVWFVNEYKLVANADSELTALSSFNPATTAIIDKRFETSVSKYQNTFDSASVIKLESYQPNNLIYKSKTAKDQLAVFSEIYYDKGWNVYVDGKIAPYFRANYVLRSMIVPAGEHKIEWKFEPSVYYTGEKVSLAFNILLILMVVGGVFMELRNSRKKLNEAAVKPKSS